MSTSVPVQRCRPLLQIRLVPLRLVPLRLVRQRTYMKPWLVLQSLYHRALARCLRTTVGRKAGRALRMSVGHTVILTPRSQRRSRGWPMATIRKDRTFLRRRLCTRSRRYSKKCQAKPSRHF